MKKLSAPVILSFLLLVVIALSGYYLFRLQKSGQVDFLIPDKISVYSDIDGVIAKLNNRRELEAYLNTLGFWNGVTPDVAGMSRNSFVPKKLVIHITDAEYPTTWFRGEDGLYLASSRMDVRGRGTVVLYLGFTKRLFKEKVGHFDGFIDMMIFEAIYARTVPQVGYYDQQAIELRDSKLKTAPFIKLFRE